MANEKPLTKTTLMAALKEAGVATKEDVREIVGQKIEKLEKVLASTFIKIEKRFDNLDETIKGESKKLQRQINDLNADSPTRKEHNDLKEKVDRHHPTN